MGSIHTLFKCYLALIFCFLFSLNILSAGPCTENDECQTAIFIDVFSDESFVCIQGCNLDASPESFNTTCQIGDYPTVWYSVSPDGIASVLNIEVHSSDFESPTITLFQSNNGCDEIQLVGLSTSNLECIVGSGGVAKAIGTQVIGNQLYYIAVSSHLSVGGDFEICISTLSNGSTCVITRDLEIVARSEGGPLEGPFAPAETVSVCMNVTSFTAVGNGCQWFQGIVPVFGNGWDPASFNALGQPLNATVNGVDIGIPGNGIYGASTWEWFNNVGYHHNSQRLQIGDLDGNGTLDICNSFYEADCPNLGGVQGGNIGPCWDLAGDHLPPGWFAYGINGTCDTPGPPIAVDWGDGNTCGCCMGPWQFCFDLLTRDNPDCLGDSTKKDLTLGFYTFADGEIGSWTGGESVCRLDQPVKMTFKTQCGKVTTIDSVQLPDVCPDSLFTFKIEAPGITTWEWNISPSWAVPYEINNGPNGYVLQVPVNNPYETPLTVKGIFIGRITGSEDVLIRHIYFEIDPKCSGVGVEDIILPYVDNDEDPKPQKEAIPNPFINPPVSKRSPVSGMLNVYPVPANDKVIIEWPRQEEIDFIFIYNADGIEVVTIPVLPSEANRKTISIIDLPSGVYFIGVKNDDMRAVQRMVKM